MLSTNTNFDAKHDLDYKTPIYIAEFSRSGWSPPFSKVCKVNAADTSYKDLIESISGGSQNVSPEKGTASVSGYTMVVKENADNDVLSLIASDEAQCQNVQVSLKAGYDGNDEADLLPIFTGWVSGLKLSPDHSKWIFSITDPSKKLQRHIAWGATDVSPVTYSGNPINILLQILTSTGAGTNGDYDILSSTKGVGIPAANVAISEMEDIRESWFPGSSFNLSFSLTEHVRAKDFIENEILKVLNCYPKIDGQGRYSIIPFKPTLPAYNSGDVQEFTKQNIISWELDLNFREMINEVEFKYNFDGSDFDQVDYWADGTSINLRSVGNAPMTIESKGLKESYNPAADEIAESRKNRILARYKVPPLKLTIKTFFSRWLTEAGDIVPVTHEDIPDPVNGIVGISDRDMEVVKRSIDWRTGVVTLELIETGFLSNQYAVISPSMTVVAGIGSTSFTVSSADAAKYSGFTNPEVHIRRPNGLTFAQVTITDITGTTVTVDDMGETPVAGCTVGFTGYLPTALTDEQKKYGFMCDSGGYLGEADEDPHIITP